MSGSPKRLGLAFAVALLIAWGVLTPRPSTTDGPEAGDAASGSPSAEEDLERLLGEAGVLIEQGHLRQAVKTLRRARDLAPSAPRPAGRLGLVLYEMNREEAAEAELRDAIELGSDDGAVAWTLAQIDARRSGRDHESAEAAHRRRMRASEAEERRQAELAEAAHRAKLARQEARFAKADRTRAEAEAASAEAEQRRDEARETLRETDACAVDLERDGGALFVDVVVNGVELSLSMDTGATITVLTTEAAELVFPASDLTLLAWLPRSRTTKYAPPLRDPSVIEKLPWPLAVFTSSPIVALKGFDHDH